MGFWIRHTTHSLKDPIFAKTKERQIKIVNFKTPTRIRTKIT